MCVTLKAMTCTVCGAPGAAIFLREVHCLNPICRWYDRREVDKSEYDPITKTINGDPLEEIKAFLKAMNEGED